jgi:hypothetical protein
MKYITIFYPNSLVLQQLNLRSSRQSSRLTPLIKWKPVNQWRRHGEDWGGHVPPSSLQSQFSNLSKSGEKNEGGGVRL